MSGRFSEVHQMLTRRQGLRIAYLGDSISEIDKTPGWFGGASGRTSHYGEVLRDRFVAKYGYQGIGTRYLGVGGQNTYQALGRMEIQLLPIRPEILIIEVGANDEGYRPLTPEQSGFALERMIEEAAWICSPAMLVVSAMSGFQEQAPIIKRIELQRAACLKFKVPFVDVRAELNRQFSMGRTWTDFFPNESDCHLTDAGHELLADCIWRAFEAATA